MSMPENQDNIAESEETSHETTASYPEERPVYVEVKEMPKKYVFKIDYENIPFIESLSHDERSEIINEMIYERVNYDEDSAKSQDLTNKIKNGLIVLLIVLIGVPILMTVINLSLSATQNSYKQMENNFKVLYK